MVIKATTLDPGESGGTLYPLSDGGLAFTC